MQYKPLGNTGLLVSTVCFGTMTFGGGDGFWKAIGNTAQSEADQLIKTCIDSGINFFDTADVYSEGQSETILGQSLKNLSDRPQRRSDRHKGVRAHRTGPQ